MKARTSTVPTAVLILCLLGSALPMGSSAGSNGPRPRFHVLAGGGLTNITESNQYQRGSSEAKANLRVGVGLALEVSEKCTALLLVSYDHRKFRHSGYYDPGIDGMVGGQLSQDISIGYITTGVHGRGVLTEVFPIFLGAGLEVGLPVSATKEIELVGETSSYHFKEVLRRDLGIPDIGLVAEIGGGVDLGPFVCLPSVSYTIGLTDIKGDDRKQGGLLTGVGESNYRILSLSIGLQSR